jgi:hypothetical protein
MPIQWHNGGILWANGGIAFDPACCCGGTTPTCECPCTYWDEVLGGCKAYPQSDLSISISCSVWDHMAGYYVFQGFSRGFSYSPGPTGGPYGPSYGPSYCCYLWRDWYSATNPNHCFESPQDIAEQFWLIYNPATGLWKAELWQSPCGGSATPPRIVFESGWNLDISCDPETHRLGSLQQIGDGGSAPAIQSLDGIQLFFVGDKYGGGLTGCSETEDSATVSEPEPDPGTPCSVCQGSPTPLHMTVLMATGIEACPGDPSEAGFINYFKSQAWLLTRTSACRWRRSDYGIVISLDLPTGIFWVFDAVLHKVIFYCTDANARISCTNGGQLVNQLGAGDCGTSVPPGPVGGFGGAIVIGVGP